MQLRPGSPSSFGAPVRYPCRSGPTFGVDLLLSRPLCVRGRGPLQSPNPPIALSIGRYRD
jgi:hypothetical protein